jgi:organic hydroperoxide reductase OsmC/OhrA
VQQDYTIRLTLDDGYAFTVDFDDPALPLLRVDEPPPLGQGDGPNPIRLLGAAIANCLAASFLFCVRKARIDVDALRATATVHVTRSDTGRLRISGVDVELDPRFAAEPGARVDRCLELFEDFCTVTASVREGITVKATVHGAPASPALLLQD